MLYFLLLQRERNSDNHQNNGGKPSWSRLHLEAARLHNPSMMALTPPRGDDPADKDVNTRGPGTRTCDGYIGYLNHDTLFIIITCDVVTSALLYYM